MSIPTIPLGGRIIYDNHLVMKKVLDNIRNYSNFNFYKKSLKTAGDKINKLKINKALKDVVGKEYEEHRKNIYEKLEFKVNKNKNNASWNPDWSIYYNDKLVAFEEDKGHYSDLCFLKRTINNFIETIHNYKKINEECPILILNSFTRYNNYHCIEKHLEIYNQELVDIFHKKFRYNYINKFDRMNTKKWFSSNKDDNKNPYDVYQNDELILKDINFMLSLKN